MVVVAHGDNDLADGKMMDDRASVIGEDVLVGVVDVDRSTEAYWPHGLVPDQN